MLSLQADCNHKDQVPFKVEQENSHKKLTNKKPTLASLFSVAKNRPVCNVTVLSYVNSEQVKITSKKLDFLQRS